MELDGGVSRVAGLLDTLAAADRMQAAAARARADAMLSNGAFGAPAHLTGRVPCSCSTSIWVRSMVSGCLLVGLLVITWTNVHCCHAIVTATRC